MTSRKTQQEIDKTFKKVAEGIQEFDNIYEKIYSSSNAAQKDKLEDNLKREIKKLQRFRDQIKTWAAGNEVKDKAPLLEQRKRIEKCMEQFKAVEKEMKTKAYSKEGLSQSTKLDPKEKEREEVCDFLSEQVDEIGRILESLDAEEDTLQAAVKKNKRDSAKSDRLSDISIITERYQWHESKLQLLLRALQNGSVETAQVNEIKEDIEYAIKEGNVADFEGENEALYDDFNLDQEEAAYGLVNENDKISSQDAQSIQEEAEPEPVKPTKSKSDSLANRRPSTQMKSPLPILSTLNTMPPPATATKEKDMKPAPVPARPPGEGLKYASAAAAAAASDKSGVGIAPLPPPPGSVLGGQPSAATSKTSIVPSPTPPLVQPAENKDISRTASIDGVPGQDHSKSPALSQTSAAVVSVPSSVPATPAMEKAETSPHPAVAGENSSLNGDVPQDTEGEESIYHLPPGLQDLIQSFETTKSRVSLQPNPSIQRLLQASHETAPETADAERPRHYKPQFRFNTPPHYPQDTLPIFDDPRLYETGRIDTDTLFYIFYYRQGTYQQYLAAKSLKSQSWRFHKQYQTWFQRHEEPKNITEDFEQGTYRFFDYESTWMNRRKADFKFVYKYLEDDL